jgi:hypothetical protein
MLLAVYREEGVAKPFYFSFCFDLVNVKQLF